MCGVVHNRRAHGWLAATALTCLPAVVSAAPTPRAHELPLTEATEWTVLVFGARFPDALADKPVPFTVEAKWQAGGQAGGSSLNGNATRFATAGLPLAVPGDCSSLVVSLNWEAPGVDLDLGLIGVSSGLRLAPLFTVLKPERVRLDAQTAPFYRWLASAHPDWWKGYPFWAEVEAAPRRDHPKESE